MKRASSGLAAIALLTSALFALAACGGDNKNDNDATATPPVTSAATAPGPTASSAFEGAQVLMQGTLGYGTSTPTDQATLVRVETGEHEGFDRIVFEFAGAGTPVYRVEYVTEATDCGSGEPTFPSGGQAAFLQVKFMPAVAHDEQGQITIVSTDISANLPSIMRAKQSCDVEADVTWAVLLGERTDFRAIPLVNPPRLAVDIAHP